MARSPRPPLTLALTVAIALPPLACGGEDARLLPGGTAREITANLDTVQQLSDEGDCVGAESAAQQVEEQIEALRGVDRRLKQALEDGAQRLEEVIVECEDTSVETVPPPEPEGEEEEDAGEDEKREEKEREAEEKEQEAEEKEREAEEKERERAEAEAEREEGDDEGDPALPPQANGEGKGLDGGEGGPGGSSGGVSPGSAVGEGE